MSKIERITARTLQRGTFPLLTLTLVGLGACSGSDGADSTDADARAATGAAVTANLLETDPQEAPVPAGEPIDVGSLGHDRGSSDAPIQVIEFSDFGCGYCRKFHVETFPALMADFVETGDVVWKYVPFELGMFANGRVSAVAGQCAAEQDRFHAMGDALFERQPDWKGESNPRPVFLEIAQSLGLDMGAYESCLDAGEALQVIQSNNAVARQVGIRSTPTFFINGFPLQGALPEAVFRDLFMGIKEQLEERESETTGP
jgi:protein-disulfide isomerase